VRKSATRAHTLRNCGFRASKPHSGKRRRTSESKWRERKRGRGHNKSAGGGGTGTSHQRGDEDSRHEPGRSCLKRDQKRRKSREGGPALDV